MDDLHIENCLINESNDEKRIQLMKMIVLFECYYLYCVLLNLNCDFQEQIYDQVGSYLHDFVSYLALKKKTIFSFFSKISKILQLDLFK